MKLIAVLAGVLIAALVPAHAQQNTILDTGNFHSLQLIVDNDELLPPCVELGKRWEMTLGFDEMSHDYRRLCYHIDHCEADWSVSDGIFESDYLSGLNDQLIEDYEKSFNTTQIYTHYTLSIPNEDIRLLLSGNYRISIYDEDDDDRTPLLTAEFCIVDKRVSLGMQITDNTDIDFQQQHQQVSIELGYGTLHVTDPDRELKVFVLQNRRQDTRVQATPNIRKSSGLEFTHQRNLIFPGSNECHRFSLLDVRGVNLNVDNIRWFEPYYHATLFEDMPTRNYSFEQDQNGAFIIHNSEDEDNETTCEYAFVHFRLKTKPLPGGLVYVHGNWATSSWPSDEYKMEYNEEDGEYQVAILLKQGYYDYRFLQLEDGKGTSRYTDGNFYQTRNEYQVLVYYKEPGGRYDKLVGYAKTEKKE